MSRPTNELNLQALQNMSADDLQNQSLEASNQVEIKLFKSVFVPSPTFIMGQAVRVDGITTLYEGIVVGVELKIYDRGYLISSDGITKGGLTYEYTVLPCCPFSQNVPSSSIYEIALDLNDVEEVNIRPSLSFRDQPHGYDIFVEVNPPQYQIGDIVWLTEEEDVPLLITGILYLPDRLWQAAEIVNGHKIGCLPFDAPGWSYMLYYFDGDGQIADTDGVRSEAEIAGKGHLSDWSWG